MIVVNNSKKDGKNVFILQINFVAESGKQVKRLREYIVGYELKKLVTVQMNIVAES